MDELIIGSHVGFGSGKQLLGSVEEALSYGANTFMFYTGAPQNTRRNPIRDEYTYEAYKLMKENGIKLENVVIHAPYIVNLGNLDNFDFSVDFLRGEIERASLLGINSVSRIEMFDNAHLFGSFNVSGMVTFIDGKKAPQLYRKFKITNDKNDDYGTMREVIYRRYFRVLKDNLERPDLILVDGGVGQVNVAREVISELGMNIPVAGLKKDDKHSTNMLLGRYPLTEIEIKKDSDRMPKN